MFKNIQIPPSFSLIQKGKISLLLKEEYKDLLLVQGIADVKSFLKKSSQTSHFLKGRTPHPSIPLEDGGYWVECPELTGCSSQGDSVEEALDMIKDAIRGHLEVEEEVKKERGGKRKAA
jgi:predicted RNase H-like HicB family nuclease